MTLFNASRAAAALFLAATVTSVGAAPSEAAGFKPVTQKSEFVTLVAERSLHLPLYGVELRVNANGTVSGEGAGRPVRGRWHWSGSYFCGEIYWGERNIGDDCRAVSVLGGRVRFVADRGTGRAANFRLR